MDVTFPVRPVVNAVPLPFPTAPQAPPTLCSMSKGLAEMSGLLGVTRVYGEIEGPAILCWALSPRKVRALVPGKL